ncbi:hypothetical protein MIND_00423100 [Mycena indigotica]|uniref:HNH nuclease domain-containing protein n=1 Tax=Mycena indigotica TaxID=2126181 RepID=A0A8H6SVU8_9AGAR|nr:uncharacterized protein MIND_00423100 [Mycena indigotica]KAF7306319.1 hypothetical protein MIND_00423100 [Mycena indigotica]
MEDESEPSSRPRWIPATLLATGTLLTVAPLIYLWRAKRTKAVSLNTAAPPPRRLGSLANALPSRAPSSGSASTIPQTTDKDTLLSRFAVVSPWSDNATIPSGSQPPRYSSSYSVSSAWKDDDDDDWGVRPGPVDPNDNFNGTLYTLQAFGAATLIVTALGIGGVWGLVRYLEVDNMHDFGHKMRLEVMDRMPFLAARMRNALNLSTNESKTEPKPWSYDESQDRLSDAFDKGGVSAWATAFVQEHDHTHILESDPFVTWPDLVWTNLVMRTMSDSQPQQETETSQPSPPIQFIISGHTAQVASHWQPDGDPCPFDPEDTRDDDDDNFSLRLHIPLDIIRNLCLKPAKFLRFLGYCILGLLGVVKSSLHGPPLDDDAELEAGATYYFRRPRGKFHLGAIIDLILLKRPSSASSSSVCGSIENRDPFCIFSGSGLYTCETAHIIPFSKALFLDCIIRTRLSSTESLAGMAIDDVRNAFMVSASYHRSFDNKALAVMKTPNLVLGVEDIPISPPHSRPRDGIEYPSHERYTAQWLVYDPDSNNELPKAMDAMFNATSTLDKPSQILLDYNYGVAALARWLVKEDTHLLNVNSPNQRGALGLPSRPISPSPAPLGPQRSRRTSPQHQAAIDKRNAWAARIEEAENIVFRLWMGSHPEVAAQIHQEHEDGAERLEQWRLGVNTGSSSCVANADVSYTGLPLSPVD